MSELSVIFTNKDIRYSEFKRLFKVPLVIYAPPPHMLSAKMSPDYRKISLTFLQPAWSAKKQCKDLFTKATVAALGSKFRCFFKGTRELRVFVGRGATIKPGNTVGLLKDSFQARFQQVADFMPATDIFLAGSNTPIVPIADISGPSTIGACNRLRITGRKSRGSGGRPLVYTWDVEFAQHVNVGLLSSNITDELTSIKTRLSSLSPSTNTLVFNKNELAISTQAVYVAYNFTLSVTNFLDVESVKASLVTTKINTILPKVSVLGGRRQRIKTKRLNKIQSRARIPSCVDAVGGLNFDWDINDFSVQLDDQSKHNANLYIYPGTLEGGETYTLTLLVSLKADPMISTSVTIQLDVISSPLVAKIKGGNRIVSKLSNFVLDGSLSYDPDRGTTEEWFEWSCYDSHSHPCFIPDINNTDQYVRLELPSTKKVTIKSDLLDVNGTYLFNLNYNKGLKTSSKAVNITIAPGNPPKVKIFPRRSAKENTEKAIKIRSKVFSNSGDTKIWVECVNTEEYAFVNLTEPGILLTPIEIYRTRRGMFPFGIVLNKGVLDGGLTYKFVIYAENSDGLGRAELVLDTNAPPAIGSFESDVLNGTALTTDFTLNSVEGWEDDDDDLPLTYKYGFYAGEGHKHYLGAPSFESEVSVKLPSGDQKTNGSLNLFVEVSDVHGAMSEASLKVAVSPPTMDLSTITNIKSSVDEAIESDDLSLALSSISSTITTFEETTPGNSIFHKINSRLLQQRPDIDFYGSFCA